MINKELTMKKRIITLLVFVAVGMTAFSQTRDDISVYIAPVTGSPEQAAFFHENFTTETVGAGYNVTENAKDADYTLRLTVKPNMILYDDGTTELAPPEEKQNILYIGLDRNEDKAEIVAFSFAFTTLDEMYDFNLYLLYEAMANVPLTKLDGVARDDRWRNKWLYIRASFDYPITFYQLMEPKALWGGGNGDYNDAERWHNLDHRINPFPAATLGLEFQYLNWMSSELNFNLSFSDPMSNSFIPAIQIEQKFPIKPSDHFMIEPYAAVSFPIDTSMSCCSFPKVGIGGGVQLGVKGGSIGSIFVDVNYIQYLGNVVIKNNSSYYPYPSEIQYNRFVVGIGIGYKAGFYDRKTR
jgi:hypothetical protein